jgi:20S proteasome alpha/beta subunit
MLLKPHPGPYFRSRFSRLRKEKRVTLIVGLVCTDGILLCSDREESGGLAKASVRKIFEYGDQNCFFAIATAGHSALSDIAVNRIDQAAKAAGPKFAATHEKVIEDVLREIYKTYVWPDFLPKDAEREIGLIVALYINATQEFHLYLTVDEVLQPRPDYACDGCGSLLGEYFLERLYERPTTTGEAMALMAFIVREAKDSIGAVGRETEMVALHSTGMARTFFARSMDREIPHLSQCVAPFWKDKK